MSSCSRDNPVLECVRNLWNINFKSDGKESMQTNMPSIYRILKNLIDKTDNKIIKNTRLLYYIYKLGLIVYYNKTEDSNRKIIKNKKYYDLFSILYLIFLCHIEESKIIEKNSFENLYILFGKNLQ